MCTLYLRNKDVSRAFLYRRKQCSPNTVNGKCSWANKRMKLEQQQQQKGITVLLMLIFYFSPWIRGFSSPACNCSAGCDSVGFPGTICWLSHSQRPKPEQREHWESRMVVMWKLDRKRCLREMVSVSRCHRDLFLFLWGFTLVTKVLSGSSPTPHPAPKRRKHSAFVMETALWARLFFCSDLDLGLRFEIVKGVIL